MWAMHEQWADTVGTIVIIAAAITALRVITGWSVVRWVVKRLIHDPMIEAVGNVVDDKVTPMLAEMDAKVTPVLEDIRTELTYNGGTTVKDMVRQIARRQEQIEAGRQAEQREDEP